MSESAVSWPDALSGFGAHFRASGRSRSTRTTYLSYLQRFAREHAWLSPWAVTPDHVAVWLSRLPSVQYGRRAAGSLRLFYACAVRAGHLAASPAAVTAPSGPGAAQEGQAVRVQFLELWIEPWPRFSLTSARGRRPDRSAPSTGPISRPWPASSGTRAVTTGSARGVAGRPGAAPRAGSRPYGSPSFYGWAARTGRVAVFLAAELACRADPGQAFRARSLRTP